MALFRTKNRALWAKVESVAGTDAVPTSSNAIYAENPRLPYNLRSVNTNESSSSLDTPSATPAGGTRSPTARVYFRGAGTAGSLPDYDPLLRGCTFASRRHAEPMTGTAAAGGASTLTLAAAVTGTAQAGASGTITLASGASAVNDFYNGRIVRTTGGTGSGQSRTITDYVGATKIATVDSAWSVTPDATTTYSVEGSVTDNYYKGMMLRTTGGTGSGQARIVSGYNGTTKVITVQPAWVTPPDGTTTYSFDAGVRYTAQSSLLESISMWVHKRGADAGNAKLGKALGCQGNVVFNLGVGDNCYMDFSFQGSLVDDSDVTDPGSFTPQNTVRIPFIGANVYLDETQVALRSISIDLGNQVTPDPNPNQANGYDNASVVNRAITGRISIPGARVATRDELASWRNNTPYDFAAWWGPSAGNRMAIMMSGFVFTNIDEEDADGNDYSAITFGAQSPDDAIYLFAH